MIVSEDQPIGQVECAHDSNIWSMAWHPMGHILVTGSNDFSTRFWTRQRPGDLMKDPLDMARSDVEAMGYALGGQEG